MNVNYKHLFLTILIAFVLLLGSSMLIDLALSGKINLLVELFTAVVLAVPVGFIITLVRNNWGKEKRSTKKD